jgi:hypothetical protein
MLSDGMERSSYTKVENSSQNGTKTAMVISVSRISCRMREARLFCSSTGVSVVVSVVIRLFPHAQLTHAQLALDCRPVEGIIPRDIRYASPPGVKMRGCTTLSRHPVRT